MHSASRTNVRWRDTRLPDHHTVGVVPCRLGSRYVSAGIDLKSPPVPKPMVDPGSDPERAGQSEFTSTEIRDL
jgi:hypothetical protein